MVHSDWLKKSGGIDQPAGSVPGGTKVAVIGGGIGGMAAAYELQKCGTDVTLFESGDRVGGRCYSIALGSSDIAEMGAMRFPPSEDLLYYYAAELGFKFEDNFPDPGHYETFISYKGNGMLWPAGTQPPEAFKKVHDGWVDFVTNGVRKSGQTAFVSATKLQELLRGIDKNPGNVAVVTEAFQAYLDEFGADSFYTGLKKIFGKDHKWDPPGGAVWDDEDFTKFGTLGVGSGGFGPLYTVGFNYIFRLIPNGLETDQAIFPAGIQRLCETLRSRFVARGGSVILGTPAEISSVGGDHVVLSVNGPSGKLKEKVDRVIVATSTRSMEMGQFLTGPNYPESGNLPALSPAAVEAVSRIHVVSSTKLFVRTKKFWSDSKYPRNILTDTKVPQLYTLNYGGKEGDTETGMVLVTYTWQDDSTKTLAFDDKKGLLEELKRQLALVVQSTEFADYADQIVPIDGDDDIQMISWQTEPGFFGGFTLAQPGQDTYIQQVFFDFMKAKQAGDADSGVYLATDCITFNGGWIDGALQSSLNAVSAVVLSVGGKFNEHIKRHPLDVFLSHLNYLLRVQRGNTYSSTLILPVKSVEEMVANGMIKFFLGIFIVFGTVNPSGSRSGNNWFRNVEYWTQRDAVQQAGRAVPVACVKYEDMVRNGAESMQPLCDMLGLSKQQLADALLLAKDKTKVDGKFFWKQKCGLYKDILPEDLIAKFRKHHGERVAALGYEI